MTGLRDELGLTVQDLQAQRNHLRDAATRLRLGVRPDVVMAELDAAGCWVVTGTQAA